MGAPSVNDGEIAPEVMNLTAAAASSECQTALVEGPAAARTALAKHGASIPAELSQALETVGSYATNEVSFIVPPPFPALSDSFSACEQEPLKREFAVNNIQPSNR